MLHSLRATEPVQATMFDSAGGSVRAMETFEARLKRALELSGIPVAQLAKVLVNQQGQVGVSRQAVYAALRGESKSMSAENVARAARAMAVDWWWLATGEGVPKPPIVEATGRLRPSSELPELLSALGRLLATAPPNMRAAIGTNLQAWAVEGGAPHYQTVLQALFEAANTTRQRARA